MKLNLRCKRCGNTKEFSTCSRIAKWNEETEKWRPKFSPREFVICDKCNSVEIEGTLIKKEAYKDEARE